MGYEVTRLRADFEGQMFPWLYPLAVNGRRMTSFRIDQMLVWTPDMEPVEAHMADGSVRTAWLPGPRGEIKYLRAGGRVFDDGWLGVVEHLRGGIRYAIEYDGQRWVPAPDHEDSCEVTD